MKFKFRGVTVEINGDEVICKDELVRMLLSPVVAGASGGPEDGDPQLNAITRMFGEGAVTDVAFGEDMTDDVIY